VDDDLETRETFETALSVAGYAVNSVASGAEALHCLRNGRVDAAVLEMRLPDLSAIDIALLLLAEDRICPFIVVSGFLTTSATVAMMRLGAYDVIDKPIDADGLCTALAAAIRTARASSTHDVRAAGDRRDIIRSASYSSAERWASSVLKACDAKSDPRTLHEWAHVAGLSYTSLRELRRMLEIRAHDARDLARLLRAVVNGRRYRCSPKVFLDVGDERTLRLLMQRAGVECFQPGLEPDDFLRWQQLVSFEHQALRLLRTMVSDPQTISWAATRAGIR
jgi:DNA-binding response OmpR family regulator